MDFEEFKIFMKMMNESITDGTKKFPPMSEEEQISMYSYLKNKQIELPIRDKARIGTDKVPIPLMKKSKNEIYEEIKKRKKK